jgi:hypothetical protein
MRIRARISPEFFVFLVLTGQKKMGDYLENLPWPLFAKEGN